MRGMNEANRLSLLLRCGFVAFHVVLSSPHASNAQDKNDVECSAQKLKSAIDLWSWEDIREFNQRCCKRNKTVIDTGMCELAISIEKKLSKPFKLSEVYCIVMYIHGSPQKNCLGSALTIGFDNNSTNLTSFAEMALKEFVENHADDSNLKLHIVGHANRTGPEDRNRTLSLQRADIVAKYLRQRLRADIDIEGKGSASPLKWELSDKDGLQRRVEISIIEASGGR
jgi:outer membrane protein OmpA-like peptidoglycan-associated protein